MVRFKSVIVFAVLLQLVVLPASAKNLSMTQIGEGTVSPSVGVHSYRDWFPPNVTISATPAAGWVFDRWEGDCEGLSNPATFKMSSHKTASAIFRPLVETAENALVRYVGKNEAVTNWYEEDEDTHFGWQGVNIVLTSLQWRDASEVDRPTWTHDLVMVIPWFSGDDCIFLINGGSNPVDTPSPDGTIAFAATLLGRKFAQLDQVPNQPLYFTDEVNVRRTEDEILAYSLDKALLTGDEEWPVHCAMTKAAVLAMDAIQAYNSSVEDFLVLGGSKRGWATWLTAAIDPRVDYIVPLVIDVLNFPDQVNHHWEAYGLYSSAIQDYVDFDLFCRVNEPGADDLLEIVDPYRYLDDLTMPKLIVNASGDQFFLPDSSRFYLEDVLGDTHVRYVPNKDHYMDDVLDDITNLVGLLQWGLARFDHNDVPNYSWTVAANGQITVTTSDGPDSVKLWQATNTTARDFRLETIGEAYTSSTLTDQGGGTYIGYCPPPAQGWTAFFVELSFGQQVYTTEIVVNPDTLPFAGTHCD